MKTSWTLMLVLIAVPVAAQEPNNATYVHAGLVRGSGGIEYLRGYLVGLGAITGQWYAAGEITLTNANANPEVKELRRLGIDVDAGGLGGAAMFGPVFVLDQLTVAPVGIIGATRETASLGYQGVDVVRDAQTRLGGGGGVVVMRDQWQASYRFARPFGHTLSFGWRIR